MPSVSASAVGAKVDPHAERLGLLLCEVGNDFVFDGYRADFDVLRRIALGGHRNLEAELLCYGLHTNLDRILGQRPKDSRKRGMRDSEERTIMQ